MEIQFQQQRRGGNPIPTSKMSKFMGRNSKSKNNISKFIGVRVRQRPSGRWVAEIKDTTQKIRVWLGTFETAEEAARAYDQADCLLHGSNTRTNFITHVSHSSPIAFRIRNLLNRKKKSNQQILDSSPITRTTSNSTASSSSASTGDDDSFSLEKVHEDISQLFDDDYKPNLRDFSSENEKGSCQISKLSWGFGGGIDRVALNQAMVELPEERSEMELTEFERMKVERVFDPNEAIWDLPPLCSLFC